jgi:RNA recognition motif-containing protein
MGSETAVEFARQKRWDRLRAVLASFGPITRIKEHWDRHFVFVVYEEREHAEKAMEVLSSWDERVKIVTAIRKQLLDEAQPLVYTPTPDFYLRWPTKEPHPVRATLPPTAFALRSLASFFVLFF